MAHHLGSSLTGSPSPTTSTPKKSVVGLSPPALNLSTPNAMESFNESGIGPGEAEAVHLPQASQAFHAGAPRGSQGSSKQQWLSALDANFVNKIVGGLEVSLRGAVEQNIRERKKLAPKQNKAVKSSVNHQIFQFIGNQRPDANLCR